MIKYHHSKIMNMDIFLKKSDPSYFSIRTNIEQLISTSKKISLEPDRNYEKPEISEYLPIHWELNQVYSLINTYYKLQTNPNDIANRH
jgi:hypothetical protein